MDEEEIISNPFEDDEDELEEESTCYTYRMDIENKRIIGKVDGIEAMMQHVFKTLQTRRFAYLIYDEQYGCDIYNKIGNADLSEDYLESDMPAMVEDAFLNDEEILGIEDLSYEIVGGDGVLISFAISTVYGDADFEGVIADG